jgi:hypothetical protein
MYILHDTRTHHEKIHRLFSVSAMFTNITMYKK